MNKNIDRIIDLCRSCAASIYATKPPNERYADDVARLLAGTAATESFFKYRRQVHFDWSQESGAWGLWQTEQAAITDSMRLLQRSQALRERAARWLYDEATVDLDALLAGDSRQVVRVLMYCDALGCLFARLHYLRVMAAVPGTEGERARYYKTYYNTRMGKGTPEKYLADFAQYVAGHWPKAA